MGTAIALMALSWGTSVLIAGGVAALYAGGRAIVGGGQGEPDEAIIDHLRHIGNDACRAADQLSERYLNELENTLDHHSRR